MFIWMILAFQAGILNIGGLLACRTFVSHVTGYISLAAHELESNQIQHALALLLMLVIFMLGSMTSGILIDSKMRENKKPKYFYVFGLLSLITCLITIGGLIGLFGEFGDNTHGLAKYILIGLLCFSCGLQNGVVTLVSRSVVRTTHATGLVTDLGIGIVRSLRSWQAKIDENESQANLMRVGILFSFFIGSVIGYPIFRSWQFLGFGVTSFISASLFVLTSYFQLFKRRA